MAKTRSDVERRLEDALQPSRTIGAYYAQVLAIDAEELLTAWRARVPVVERILHGRPICEERIHLPTVSTLAKTRRIRRAERAGHEADVCGRPATWFVDGCAMCTSHAGRSVLEAVCPAS